MFEAVLFDLDGTLADTAPDLGGATNILLLEEGRPQHSLETLRPYVSQGVRGLLKAGFGIDSGHPDYERLSNRFLEIYAARICDESQLFQAFRNCSMPLKIWGCNGVSSPTSGCVLPIHWSSCSPSAHVRPASSAAIQRQNPNLRHYRFCMPANCSTARRNARFMSVTTCVTSRPATQPVV